MHVADLSFRHTNANFGVGQRRESAGNGPPAPPSYQRLLPMTPRYSYTQRLLLDNKVVNRFLTEAIN